MNKFNTCDYMDDEKYDRCMKAMADNLLEAEKIAEDREFHKFYEAYDPYGEER